MTAWTSNLPMIDEQNHTENRAHHQIAAVLAHEPAGAPLAEELDSDDGCDTEEHI